MSKPGQADDDVTITHVSRKGEVRMVDVSHKPKSRRRAVAEAVVRMRRQTLRLVASASAQKGDVLAAARIAGIMAAKRTPEIVPLCHTVSLVRVDVALTVQARAGRIVVRAEAEAVDRTGVEMEAMVAASVAALTLYDMLKGVERGIVVEHVALLEKSGGRSGDWRRGAAP
jgi:cyclic pyranopterin phosphate synthase